MCYNLLLFDRDLFVIVNNITLYSKSVVPRNKLRPKARSLIESASMLNKLYSFHYLAIVFLISRNFRPEVISWTYDFAP